MQQLKGNFMLSPSQDTSRHIRNLIKEGNVAIKFHPHLTIESIELSDKTFDASQVFKTIMEEAGFVVEDVKEAITKEELTKIASALGLFTVENYQPNNSPLLFTDHTIEEFLKTKITREDAMYEMAASRVILVAANRAYSEDRKVTIGQHGDFGYWRSQVAAQLKAENSSEIDDSASRWGTDGLALVDGVIVNSGFDASKIEEKFQHQNEKGDTLKLSELTKVAEECGLTSPDQKGLLHYKEGDLGYWAGRIDIKAPELEQLFYAMALVRAVALKDPNIRAPLNVSYIAEQLIKNGIFSRSGVGLL